MTQCMKPTVTHGAGGVFPTADVVIWKNRKNTRLLRSCTALQFSYTSYIENIKGMRCVFKKCQFCSGKKNEFWNSSFGT